MINNRAFYTTDGMRFEFFSYKDNGQKGQHKFALYDSMQTVGKIVYPNLCYGKQATRADECTEEYAHWSFRCGSYGLIDNVYNTTISPCLMFVDVNGDRKLNPANINCKEDYCASIFKYSDPNGIKLSDTFTIMITDRGAKPYGVAAQRAMYDGKIK